MQRLKIMSDDVSMACGDKFGIGDMQDRLEEFCRAQGIEVPITRLIEVDGVLMPYAVPMHLSGKDRWEEFDAEAIFLLVDFPDKEDREAEACRLSVMAEEFERPCLLTTRAAFSPRQDQFYRKFGFMKMPVTWSDEADREYEVLVKGQLEMGSFVSLIEHVEYIGKEIVYKNYGK